MGSYWISVLTEKDKMGVIELLWSTNVHVVESIAERCGDRRFDSRCESKRRSEIFNFDLTTKRVILYHCEQEEGEVTHKGNETKIDVRNATIQR
jgi:hypothetical protein